MKNIKLLILSLFFFVKIGFAQNYITYSSKDRTIDLDSGVEGTVDITVNCYGNNGDSLIYLDALTSCGNNDGIFSTSYTNGNTLSPGESTIIRYKFKKSVTTNTQIIYKFSTNGSCTQDESNMIKITVNYKAGTTTTTPPPLTYPNLIYIGDGPATATNITINAGDTPPLLNGSTAGNYTTYKWFKTTSDFASYQEIPGATNYFYSPGKLFVTTKFIRLRISEVPESSSNEITITVVPAPILNNVITLNGTIVEGSMPTGGLGDPNSYLYSWYIIDEDGDNYQLPDTSSNLILTNPQFTAYLNSTHNFILKRMVSSGNQILASNGITLPHITPIQNNSISINGNIVTGSVPTGGLGEYKYSWAIYYTGDPIDFDETTKDLDLTSHLNQINTILQIDSAAKLVRIVTSGASSTSNKLSLGGLAAKTISTNYSLAPTVYPNPTSEVINFTTNSPSTQEIEILLYLERSNNTQSIFKGAITSNQIFTWHIPANYPKGIYFYKIISNNEEIKSGKIIFQ